VIKIAKTELTKQLEQEIISTTSKQGVFGSLEVTIGWWGNERVDFMTMDTKDIFRCYEIKISKSDFHSKCKNSFVGNYNYYVMPNELYEQVKDEIPKHIGVYTSTINKYEMMYFGLVKNPKKQELQVDKDILKNSMIRSQNREVSKYYNSVDMEYISNLNKRIKTLEKSYEDSNNKRIEISNELYYLKDKIESPNDYIPKSRINRIKLICENNLKQNEGNKELEDIINDLEIILMEGGEFNE